jgi:hypothetical protein
MTVVRAVDVMSKGQGSTHGPSGDDNRVDSMPDSIALKRWLHGIEKACPALANAERERRDGSSSSILENWLAKKCGECSVEVVKYNSICS